MLDFSLESYNLLLNHLVNSGYTLMTVEQYLTRNSDITHEPVVILRHDIDRRLKKALVFSGIESELGITATYYFRYPALSLPDVIRSVARKGHEIGYHYEVMSRTSGDPLMARALFVNDIRKFREIGTIHTVCMHGAPLSEYDNLTFWDYYQLDEFDLLGEAFLSVSGVEYFSDTGRTWSPEHKMRDRLPGDLERKTPGNITSTDDLISYIVKSRPTKLYIVTHPERWAETRGEWMILYGVDFLVNFGKSMFSFFRGLFP